MRLLNQRDALWEEAVSWRHTLHANPELRFDLDFTTEFVMQRLEASGVDHLTPNVGRSGIVALIEGRSQKSGRSVGLRADMDALPIQEEGTHPHKSKFDGRMHACGHDGHTAMLLAAAKHLAETRNFDGTVVLIFQPAEEFGGGGRVMVDDGLFRRWPVNSVYAIHNWPGLDLGKVSLCSGPMMAASGRFDLELTGKGGHAAFPDKCVDPLWLARCILEAFDNIVARGTDPREALVISTTKLHVGDAYNAIADSAHLGGTIRALSDTVYQAATDRMQFLAENLAKAHGGHVVFKHTPGYPAVVNDVAAVRMAIEVAKSVVGESMAADDFAPSMAAEDFSYMLREVPGAFIAMGQGDGPFLHNPKYDFDDRLIPIGTTFWCNLVECVLPFNQ